MNNETFDALMSAYTKMKELFGKGTLGSENINISPDTGLSTDSLDSQCAEIVNVTIDNVAVSDTIEQLQPTTSLAQAQIDMQVPSKLGDGLQLQAYTNLTEQDIIGALDDPEFVEKHILTNPQIVSKIIQDYIKQVQSNRTIPTLNTSTGTATVAPFKNPKTLKDAKRVVDDFFDR